VVSYHLLQILNSEYAFLWAKQCWWFNSEQKSFWQKKEFTGFKIMGGGATSIPQNLTLTHAWNTPTTTWAFPEMYGSLSCILFFAKISRFQKPNLGWASDPWTTSLSSAADPCNFLQAPLILRAGNFVVVEIHVVCLQHKVHPRAFLLH
jgi:hypothetical protein